MKKLKLFAKSNVTEIHDANNGHAVVSWMGFDNSDIPLKQHRQNAAEIVHRYNAYPALLNALKLILELHPTRNTKEAYAEAVREIATAAIAELS